MQPCHPILELWAHRFAHLLPKSPGWQVNLSELKGLLFESESYQVSQELPNPKKLVLDSPYPEMSDLRAKKGSRKLFGSG